LFLELGGHRPRQNGEYAIDHGKVRCTALINPKKLLTPEQQVEEAEKLLKPEEPPSVVCYRTHWHGYWMIEPLRKMVIQFRYNCPPDAKWEGETKIFAVKDGVWTSEQNDGVVLLDPPPGFESWLLGFADHDVVQRPAAAPPGELPPPPAASWV